MMLYTLILSALVSAQVQNSTIESIPSGFNGSQRGEPQTDSCFFQGSLSEKPEALVGFRVDGRLYNYTSATCARMFWGEHLGSPYAPPERRGESRIRPLCLIRPYASVTSRIIWEGLTRSFLGGTKSATWGLSGDNSPR